MSGGAYVRPSRFFLNEAPTQRAEYSKERHGEGQRLRCCNR